MTATTKDNMLEKISEVEMVLTPNKFSALASLKVETEIMRRSGKVGTFTGLTGDLSNLNGHKVDDVVKELSRQLNDAIKKNKSLYSHLRSKNVLTSSKKLKPPRDVTGTSALTNPYFVSGSLSSFIEGANFGNLLFGEYSSRGFKDTKYLTVNGDDVASVKKLHDKCFPMEDLTDDRIDSHSVNKLMNDTVRNSIITTHIFNDLIQLYFHANDCVKYKEGKTSLTKYYVPDDYFKENLLDVPVTWRLNGERVIPKKKITEHRSAAIKAIEDLAAASVARTEADKLYSNWTVGRDPNYQGSSTSVPSKAFKSYTEEEVSDKCVLADRAVNVCVKEVQRMIEVITGFVPDAKVDLDKTLQRIIQQEMTFGEILEEKGNYNSEKNELKGNINSIIVNYFRIPVKFLNKDVLTAIKSPECIGEARRVESALDSTLNVLKESERVENEKVKVEIKARKVKK